MSNTRVGGRLAQLRRLRLRVMRCSTNELLICNDNDVYHLAHPASNRIQRFSLGVSATPVEPGVRIGPS
eukprot:scaffold57302_cov36-Tisochrysis_lutea.AAC.5